MFRKFTFLITLMSITLYSWAQLVKTTPAFPAQDGALTITIDTKLGNQGLANYSNTSDVYVHIGVITGADNSPGAWKYTPYSWGTTNAAARATHEGNGIYSFSIPNIRNFFNVPVAEQILKVAILLRNGNGNTVQRNADGSDMFVQLYNPSDFIIRSTVPGYEPFFVPSVTTRRYDIGETYQFAVETNAAATFTAFLNNQPVTLSASSATSASVTATFTEDGEQTLRFVAKNNTTNDEKELTYNFFVNGDQIIAPLPAGVQDGINYKGDSVTFVLYAPGKNTVNLVGEFNAWNNYSHPFYKTPDGNYFWITIGGLTANQSYAYQFLIDHSQIIADPYATLILDPWNDQYIPATTYPNMKAYPAGRSGIVSVLEYKQPAYNWQVPDFQRPDKRSLVVYELLVRDWHEKHNWQVLMDSIQYFKRLGINTIELMPVNEFEGNISWGYNPDYFFAADKYYGTSQKLKEFIDLCHRNGIAVIIDMVLNHHFGLSPMVQMYWNSTLNQPAANSPWFNQTPTHPYNVGFDMNHELPATQYFFKRVVEHWLKEYNIDGFRFDLSKGFTQKNTCTTANCDTEAEINNWSLYDASRIAIWKHYYDEIQTIAPGSYVILEHLSENSEEVELANYGIMLWGNMYHNFKEATMGWLDQSNFDWAIHSRRGFQQPHLVSYMESHDENRIMWETINFGNAAGSYNTKDTTTALKRVELSAAFFSMIPGPKMIWQFGEQGYAHHINRCEDGTINNDCRTSPKPIPWADFARSAPRRDLYSKFAHFFALRQHASYRDLFVEGNIEYKLDGAVKWMKITNDSLQIVIIGNFAVTNQSGTVSFPAQGTFYSYMNNTTFQSTGGAQSFSLAPGEYRIYTNKNLKEAPTTPVEEWVTPDQKISLKAYPNPISSFSILEFELPFHTDINISVYNMNGQKVLDVLNGYRTAGKYRIQLKDVQGAQALANGLYFVRMQLGNKTYTEKIMVQQ